MKKLMYVTAVAAVLGLPLSGYAAGYVDVGVGQSHYNADSGGASVVSEGSNPTGWTVSAGTDFTPNFGAEIGYADLGSLDRTYSIGGINGSTSYKARLGYLAATANAPVSDQFSLFGKVGVTYSRTSGQANLSNLSFDDTQHKTGYVAGVGAAYNFTPNLAGTVGYDYFGKIADNSNAGLWKIGLRARF